MDLHHCLKTFVVVVEQNSFAAAARQLYRSAPQVSKEISWLEEHLQASLLNRTTRALHITEAGQQCYDFAKQLLSDVTLFKENLLQQSQRISGKLRVSITLGFGERCLLEPLTEFLADYPDVQVEVDFSNRFVDMVHENYDVVIRTHHPNNDVLIAHKLYESVRSVFAAPMYLEKMGLPQRPQDLLNHRIIMHSALARPLRWHFKAGEFVTVDPVYLCNSIDSIVAAAVRGLGVVNISRFHVTDYIEKNQLQEVLESYMPEPTSLYVCHLRKPVIEKRVAIFVDAMIKYCRNHLFYRA